MEIGKILTINSRKFDGKIHKTWKAELIGQNDSLLILKGIFEKEINHSDLGLIRRGTISIEYYWLDKWFNIFRFYESDGTLRNFYCNINIPPKLEANVLDYVDLDIDILVETDLTYKVLDRFEFEQNAQLYKYPQTIIDKTEIIIKEITMMIQKRDFPFSDICKIPISD